MQIIPRLTFAFPVYRSSPFPPPARFYTTDLSRSCRSGDLPLFPPPFFFGDRFTLLRGSRVFLPLLLLASFPRQIGSHRSAETRWRRLCFTDPNPTRPVMPSPRLFFSDACACRDQGRGSSCNSGLWSFFFDCLAGTASHSCFPFLFPAFPTLTLPPPLLSVFRGE